MNKSEYSKSPGHRLLISFIVLTTLLVACGDEQVPKVLPPTSTAAPTFKQETNQELFFVMSVPVNWAKSSEPNSVSFAANEDANTKISVTSTSAQRLTLDSTRVLQEKLDSLKVRYPQLTQDNAGLLRLVDINLNLFKVSYKDGDTSVVEYLAQVNAPLAERAFILSGRSLAATAEQRKAVFITAFESFKSIAPLVVPATLTASAGGGDPAIIAATSGGKVTGASTVPGKATTLADWQSPPLLYGSERFVLQGLFPVNWQWRVKPFPTQLRNPSPTPLTSELANPGLYLVSPDNENSIQLGIVPNVFPANSPPPSTADYKAAYEPYVNSFSQTIGALGARTSLSELTNVGPFFRFNFIARNDTGATSGRGVVLIRSAGPHLLMSALTLGPNSSLKQNLIDGYDLDMQTLVSSIKVSKP